MREPFVPELDAREFLRWEARQPQKYELYQGLIYPRRPITLDHDQVAYTVRCALERLFPSPCRTFGAAVKVRAGNASFFYVDAGVICAEVDPDDVYVSAPRLVVEILSPSGAASYPVEKRTAFHSIASLEWLLVIHAQKRCVEVDSRAERGLWNNEIIDEGAVAIGTRSLPLDVIYARSLLT